MLYNLLLLKKKISSFFFLEKSLLNLKKFLDCFAAEMRKLLSYSGGGNVMYVCLYQKSVCK